MDAKCGLDGAEVRGSFAEEAAQSSLRLHLSEEGSMSSGGLWLSFSPGLCLWSKGQTFPDMRGPWSMLCEELGHLKKLAGV